MRSVAALVVFAAAFAAVHTAAAGPPKRCPVGSEAAAKAHRDCAPPRKLEPYDPDRMRAGGRPGFYDLGGGTEIRIGGRARIDYDVRR